jgi:hypothetical protein
MNSAHLHLVLTHVPILGVLFGTALLAIGFLRRNRVLQLAAQATLVFAALAAGATYLTGEGAEDAIESRLSTEVYVERHEDAAVVGLAVAGVAGAVALVGLALARKGRPLSRPLVGIALAAALAASGTLLWVANLGGKISHPEIRSSGAASDRDQGREDDE